MPHVEGVQPQTLSTPAPPQVSPFWQLPQSIIAKQPSESMPQFLPSEYYKHAYDLIQQTIRVNSGAVVIFNLPPCPGFAGGDKLRALKELEKIPAHQIRDIRIREGKLEDAFLQLVEKGQ